ncbi:MAG: aminotransferase class V-fold PLP-dependent enzyme [Actinobacteria bacterium]|nr:MAG: aminotransferase class V-fold PLP-dependent enzyme [Actinomycetota bacterium]
MKLDLDRLRAETPGCAHHIHFNNAGAGLMPAPVLETMTEHLELEAELGGYEAADARGEAIDDFYAATAQLLGCEAGNIAFTPNATDAFARALSSIPFVSGDVILTTRDDYISNQIAFLSLHKRFGTEVLHAPDLPEGGVDVDAMAKLMRERRARLVAATHIPTNSGLVQPVAEIGRHCRELDLLYLVDACQSVGQYAIDVEQLGCDFLSATCRKFLRGPRGSGLLYVSDRALAAGYEPLFIDMRGARWTGFEEYEQVATAARYEDWEFSYATVLGAAMAARYALAVGIEAVAERTPALGGSLRDRLAEIDAVRILDRGSERCAIVTFALSGWASEALMQELRRRGINSSVSEREHALYDFTDKDVDACVRLSPHYYNTEQEVDEVVAEVLELSDVHRGDRSSLRTRPRG